MINVYNGTMSINGIYFNFIGYEAVLECDGKITKVVEIATGKDCTDQFKQKYGQN